jgi:phage anti-repressor protein
MQELIILTRQKLGTEEVQTVNARELHQFLEVSSAFKDWIARRLTDFDFVEGVDFCSFLSESQGGRPSKGYALSIDMAKELAMVERNDKGKEARRYFIECERKAKEAARPLSQLEILAQSAQALLELDRKHQAMAQQLAATTENLARIDTQLEQVAANRVWDRCPQNCEPITKIRARMFAAHGLPAWVVDTVMRQLPLSPKVHAMIKNANEAANGSQYEVWAVADVTRIFARFVAECTHVTPAFAAHPDIKERFRLRATVAA